MYEFGEYEFDGIRFRVVAGKKSDKDRRIEWLTPEGWKAISFEPIFHLVEFFSENEDVLYPISEGYQGRRYFHTALHLAGTLGAEYAWNQVKREKRRKL